MLGRDDRGSDFVDYGLELLMGSTGQLSQASVTLCQHFITFKNNIQVANLFL